MTRPKPFRATDSPERVADFFSALYEQSIGYAALSHGRLVKDDQGRFQSKGWHDHIFSWPAEQEDLCQLVTGAIECPQAVGDGWNLYYCPTLFAQPKRHREYALGTRWVWSDLDEASPERFPPDVPRPTVLIQTSPGRYQGLWRLAYHVEPTRAQALAKALAYTVGGDRSGWDVTQLLRIPGTSNLKYGEDCIVTLEDILLDSSDSLLSYEIAAFSGLTAIRSTTITDQQAVGIILSSEGLTSSKVLRDNREKIKPRTLTLLTTPPANGDDRSKRLFEINCMLAEAGVTPHEAFTIVADCPWNKFVGRGDEKVYLAKDVLKAYQHVAAKRGEEWDDEGEPHLLIEDDEGPPDPSTLFVGAGTFIKTPIKSPGWIVENVWPAVEQGMVSGENGTLKSYFAADLAVSVATGRPFLGKFPVLTSGKVLIIQEEIEPWTMQDRLGRIARAKGVHPDQMNIEESGIDNLRLLNGYGLDLTSKKDQDMIDWACSLENPTLLILDPLYLILGAADENDATQLRPIVNYLLRLKKLHGVSVMVLHHTNKSGGIRGSTVLTAWMANNISLSHIDQDQVKIKVERKYRGFGRKPPFAIRYELDDPPGTLYNPVVEELSADGSDSTADKVKAAIQSVQDLTDGTTFEALAEELKLSDKTVRQYVHTLATQGHCRIIREGSGRGAKARIVPTFRGMEVSIDPTS